MYRYRRIISALNLALLDVIRLQKLRHLVHKALENGGSDNITGLFAVVEEAVSR